MRTAYGHIEPYSTFYLDVTPPHSLYVEQSGNPDAPAIIVLHGGPGGGSNPAMRRFFHPKKWRIISFDQRGCGRSHPLCSLDDNTTWALVEDIEALRKRLNIDQWVTFGGSWGATLAVAYAQAYPERVSGLVLRAVFLISPWEINWFYRGGAGAMLPEHWAAFLDHLEPEERDNPLEGYYARLTNADEGIRQEAAHAWTAWENAAIRTRDRRALGGTIQRTPSPAAPPMRTGAAGGWQTGDGKQITHGAQSADGPARVNATGTKGLTTRGTRGKGGAPANRASRSTEALARLECHYCLNGGFLRTPNQLLDNAARLNDKPLYIVQGRDDLVTPPITAWRLANAHPHAELTMVDGAGHSAADPGILDALVRSTDALAERLARGNG